MVELYVGKLSRSETLVDMPYMRPIGDRHASGVPSETNMPAESNRNLIQSYLNPLIYYIIFANLYLLEYCTFSNQACRSLVGLRSGMSVSNVLLIRQVCWSLIRHVSLGPNMSVSDGASLFQMGLR